MITYKRALWGIFIVSLIATLGSLYYGYFWDPVENFSTGYWFSPINALIACDMCRYIRVFQYPLAIISGLALRHNDRAVMKYIFPLATIWLFIAGYKYLLEMWVVQQSGICSAGSASCSEPWVTYFWFITLAFLWIISFLIIIGLWMLANQSSKTSQHTDNITS